ncbi:hypothetical protein ACUW9Z_000119 [Aerococcus sp. 150760007-1]|nr:MULTISPECIES: hypothetical protein [Lactobacillales]
MLVGAGQLGMAIAGRVGFNYKILIGDKKFDNVIAIADTLEGAGYDIVATEIGKADKDSIDTFIEKGQSYGEINLLINVARVSPSQASNETILKVDLYGIAVLLEEVANLASILMSSDGAFITGSEFLIDGVATEAFHYGS